MVCLASTSKDCSDESSLPIESRTKRLGSVVSVRVWLGVSVGYIESRARYALLIDSDCKLNPEGRDVETDVGNYGV